MGENISSVYKVTNTINNKKYIGITKRDPEFRWWQHKNNCKNNYLKYALYNAINKYGIENFIFEVILQSKDELHIKNEMESYFINEYNTFGKNGYNMTTGGEGQWGFKHSEETKQQMSVKATKRFEDPINREKMSKIMLNKKHIQLSKDKISNGLKEFYSKNEHHTKNIILSDEHKEKISIANKGKKKPEGFSEKLAKANSCRWEITCPNGNIEKITNLRKFCRDNNLSAENLWKVSKGIITHSQNYKCRKI